MIKSLTYKNKEIHKQWAVEVKGNEVFIEFGEINCTGWIDKKTFDNNLLALEFANQKIDEKLMKGYREVDEIS